MGNSPPLQAIEQNDITTLSKLQLKDCINELQTDRKTTLLAIACEKSNLEIVNILLKVPNINVNLGHKPPLFIACERGHEDIVKLLLNVPTINVNQEYTGMTALCKSCKLGNISIVKLLLQHSNINVNLCSPLRISCKERNLEIIKLLLKQSNIKIENTDLNIANRSGINLIEITKSFKKKEIEYKKLILKKFEMDEIKNGIIVFKPIIVKMAPNLMKNVIENENLLNNLNNEELDALQSIIDYLIYGKLQIYSNNFSILFILNRVEGEFINIKQLNINNILKNINFDNLLNTIDILNNLIKRDEQYSINSNINNNNNNNTNIESNDEINDNINNNNNNILIQLKEYCLDLMGAKRKHPDFIKIKKDSRFENYLFEIFDRDTIRNVIVNEKEFIYSKYPLSELYFQFNEENNLENIKNILPDIEININGDEIIKCHKTILSSSSTYFQAYFTGNWCKSSKTSQQDVYPIEVKYIIEYCYGIIKPIPPYIVIQVLKKAHEHEMQELYDIVYKNIDITIESFYDLIKSLFNDVDLELFKDLRIELINFAVENYKYLNLLQKFKQLPNCMRDDLIEKMLSIKFIDNNNYENDDENDNEYNSTINGKNKRKRQDDFIQPNSKERK